MTRHLDAVSLVVLAGCTAAMGWLAGAWALVVVPLVGLLVAAHGSRPLRCRPGGVVAGALLAMCVTAALTAIPFGALALRGPGAVDIVALLQTLAVLACAWPLRRAPRARGVWIGAAAGLVLALQLTLASGGRIWLV